MEKLENIEMNQEAMQELVDSFADAIKEKGASELKDLGIEKL